MPNSVQDVIGAGSHSPVSSDVTNNVKGRHYNNRNGSLDLKYPTLQWYLTQKKAPRPLGHYSRPMPRAHGDPRGRGLFLVSEVPL